MGRLVITHSTYVDDLIPWLKSLAKVKGIKTITPAVIKSVKGHSSSLVIRISTEIKGGYKLIARNRKTVQEVFVITDLTKEELKYSIDQYKPKKI